MTVKTASLALAVVFLASACRLFGFLDERVREGEAYGFVIGEDFEASIDRARLLKASHEVFEIEFGEGSGAVPFDPTIHVPADDQKIQIVVDPEVWNDTIYLTFEDGRLAEIWRFRSPTELP